MSRNSASKISRRTGVIALLLSLSCFAAGSAVPRPIEARTASTEAQAQSRAFVLRAQIAHADELYFKKTIPEITDAAYDLLKRELAAIEAANPAIAMQATVSSGDDRVGDFPIARHQDRMLSLRKTYTEAELRAFHDQVAKRLGRADVTFVVEPKFDGVAISLVFVRGKFLRATTRGDGQEGDDVTDNVRTIASLPAEFHGTAPADLGKNFPEMIELRGEIYVTFAEFERINREQDSAGEEPFTHPRNLAAGTLKLHDPGRVSQRKLSVVLYGIGACEPESLRPSSQRDLHAKIRAWGLPGVDIVKVVHDSDQMWSAVEAIGRERARYGFPTDGAVVKIDDASLQRELGVAPDAPNWAIAYKFPTTRVVAELRAITIQVGRTGVLAPVAELSPVKLSGSTVARASLHNFDEIVRRDLRVGDFVFLEKAGEIIPAITGIDLARRPAESQPYRVPTRCPSCATEVIRIIGEVALSCPNGECPAQLRRRLEHFASKGCVDIDGMGPRTIDALVTSARVKNVADLYRLESSDLKETLGKSAVRVVASIERSRHAELWRFIYGLGIPKLGPVGAKALANHFDGLAELAAAGRQDLFANGRPRLEGVSPAASEAVLVFFAQPRNCAIVAALLQRGIEPTR